MTYLPHHRRIQSGRTWSSPYDHAAFDPVRGPFRRVSTTERIAGVVLAVVIGILGAVAVAHWWAS